MGIKAIGVPDVHKRVLEALGIDTSVHDLESVEAIAAILRRAAAFHCPASPTTLLRAVLRPLQDLVADLATVSEVTENTLDAITAYGDLLETRDVAFDNVDNNQNLLYLAPPSFVMRENGSAFLTGIVFDRVSALPNDLEQLVQYSNHVRRFPAGIADLKTRLLDSGLLEVSMTRWLKCPAYENPRIHVAQYDSQLANCPSLVTGIDGLSVLDPSKPVTFYRGRWTEKASGSGKVIGRRPQAYGADIWCYVELENGRPVRFLDLPSPKSRYRGCDEAWHLQAAIDAIRGLPQKYRLRTVDGDFITIDLFSPIPMWSARRFDAVGQKVTPAQCLLSYRVPKAEVDEEIGFLQNHLWLIDSAG